LVLLVVVELTFFFVLFASFEGSRAGLVDHDWRSECGVGGRRTGLSTSAIGVLDHTGYVIRGSLSVIAPG